MQCDAGVIANNEGLVVTLEDGVRSHRRAAEACSTSMSKCSSAYPFDTRREIVVRLESEPALVAERAAVLQCAPSSVPRAPLLTATRGSWNELGSASSEAAQPNQACQSGQVRFSELAIEAVRLL